MLISRKSETLILQMVLLDVARNKTANLRDFLIPDYTIVDLITAHAQITTQPPFCEIFNLTIIKI